MNKILSVFFVFICTLCPTLLWSQNNVATWNSVSLKHEITDNLNITINEELRFEDYYSEFNKFLSELTINRKILKKLCLGIGYRFDFEQTDKYAHRCFFDFKYQIKINRFKIQFKERYQYKIQYVDKLILGETNFHHLRHRIRVKYNIPKSSIEPFCKVEFYQSLNNPIRNRIDKQRYTFGVGFPVTSFLSSDLFFRYQIRDNKYQRYSEDFIVGLSINFNI
ncbi:MAG: DUF2490 domain-containing protein [Bacteroidales bacterium]|nr:DUF2490 domain-containing protein [Bacteroidales bacterium]